MGIRYRLWQVWLNFTVREGLAQGAQADVKRTLLERERALFNRFSPRDQQHSYLVYKTLRDHGHDHPHLLAAALLHDVGKVHIPPNVWDRMWPVLVAKIAPRLAKRWGSGPARGWRRSFAIREQHPAWGAELAAAAGSHPVTIELIRRHQEVLAEDPTSDQERLLRILQWADNRS